MTAPQRHLFKEGSAGTLDKPASPAGSSVKVSGGVTPTGAPAHAGAGVAPAPKSKRQRKFRRLMDILNQKFSSQPKDSIE